jgi:small subunit ribosomal protein S16
VAADSRSQRDGRFLEGLGYYNPLTEPAEIVINEEKALKWLKQGAQPSDTAKSLLSKVGIWEKFINEKLGKPAPAPEAEPAPETGSVPSEEESLPTTEEESVSADEEPTAEEEKQEETAPETTSEESGE